MTTPKPVRAGATLCGAIIALSLSMTPASAETATTTVDIRSGNKGEVVGTATFTRTATNSGDDELTVELNVAGGIDESHLCIADEPFTSRASPGLCPYSQAATGTTARFVIPLGTAHAGEPVFAQASVVTADATAFAGWQDGRPFFGNLRIEAVIGTVEAPAGGLVGAFALTVLIGAALALRLSRRRTRVRTA